MHRNISSKRPLAGLIAALALLAAPMTDALAETVTYTLNQSNIESALPDGVDYLQVAITSTLAGTASFNVTPVFAFAQGTNYGLQSFGFNYGGSGSPSFSGLAAGWTVDVPPPSSQDGFGKFDYIVETTGNGRLPAINFTISGLGGASSAQTLAYFAKLSSGNAGQGKQYFAAHLTGIDYSTTSGFFAGSTLAPVPEPKSYAMLLAGLGFVGALARRRRIG
jgi:hypothetical protein